MSPARPRSLGTLAREIVACRACPRLVEHREAIGREKRKAYRDETYWARPLPGFGDPRARLVIIGLAPGAHGANRTGRMFTGDRSGAFLYPALFRCGLSSRPESVGRDDGLKLLGTFITAPVRCVPPDNMPSRDELATCSKWFHAELALLESVEAFLALGAIAWNALHDLGRAHTKTPFAHGAESRITLPATPARAARAIPIFASYHVSQQNTQTGRLTGAMFDAVLFTSAAAAGIDVKPENPLAVVGIEGGGASNPRVGEQPVPLEAPKTSKRGASSKKRPVNRGRGEPT